MRIIPGGCVYRGTATNAPHAGHIDQLLIPLDGPLELSVDRVRYTLPVGAALLVAADAEQQVFSDRPRVTLMFDPESLGAPLRSLARGAALVLSGAMGRRLRDFAARIEASPLADASAVEAVFETGLEQLAASGLHRLPPLDPRVEAALELFRQPEMGLDHQAVARKAAIAPDHLSHLFSEQIGISAKRYCLWARTVTAIELLGAGASATEAAQRTRFSDLAHFSRAARRQFGLPPSQLPTQGMRVFGTSMAMH